MSSATLTYQQTFFPVEMFQKAVKAAQLEMSSTKVLAWASQQTNLGGEWLYFETHFYLCSELRSHGCTDYFSFLFCDLQMESCYLRVHMCSTTNTTTLHTVHRLMLQKKKEDHFKLQCVRLMVRWLLIMRHVAQTVAKLCLMPCSLKSQFPVVCMIWLKIHQKLTDRQNGKKI